MMPAFTFQYGSTQILHRKPLRTSNLSFTFQYGSTQIRLAPFFSNPRQRFTFQYGSTQIIRGNKNERRKNYLHSNMDLLK